MAHEQLEQCWMRWDGIQIPVSTVDIAVGIAFLLFIWDNLSKSRGGSQVNLCPRAVPRFLNLSHLGRSGSGSAAPRVFGLWSGLGCGLGFAFGKSLGGPSIFP